VSIRALASEGLVTVDPHRGALVRGLSLDEVREIHVMRRLLEPEVMHRAVAAMTEAELAEAEEIQTILNSAGIQSELELAVEQHPAALEDTGIPDIPEPLRLTGVSVRASHTRFELPGSYGVSERFDLDQDLMRALRAGFPAGVRIDLVVAAVDRNTLNANRMDPQGFDDGSRVGGVIGDGAGLFGSLVPRHLEIHITDDETEHSCP
jgi:hypothetical protein